MRPINDERGFLDIYLMGIFTIGVIIVFSVLLTAAAICRQNAVASYSCFTEVADFATRTAVMNGYTGATDAPQVGLYFKDSFTGAGTFNPNSGCVWCAQGTPLPNGTTSRADGYLFTLSAVPVLIGNIPLIGPVTVPITMSYYAEL
jgi:hypothetical protein